jgi:flagellar protein FliO/FliZ
MQPLVWTLVCVVVILGLAWWVTKYVVAGGKSGCRRTGKGTEHLTVLSRLTLGKEQQLVMVRAGDRYFLIGVTAGQMTTLAEFTQQEAESWRSQQTEQTGNQTPPSFGEALRTVIQQKVRR